MEVVVRNIHNATKALKDLSERIEAIRLARSKVVNVRLSAVALQALEIGSGKNLKEFLGIPVTIDESHTNNIVVLLVDHKYYWNIKEEFFTLNKYFEYV